MSRLFHFGALLAAALVLAPLLGAQSGSSPNAARIQHVLVRGNGTAMEVEILTSGTPVTPDTQAITGPDRIVVDFPGALPAAELRALEVNRGALMRVRAGLFVNNPPITRIVLDLGQPQSYRVSTVKNAVVIKLGQAGVADGPGQNPARTKVAQATSRTANPVRVASSGSHSPEKQVAPAARLQNALLTASTNGATAEVSVAISRTPVPPLPAVVAEAPPPRVTVSYANGMLSIRADKSNLAEVLFEVQRQTQADIAIPAGAEQEQVITNLGPAPAQDVLAALLNGSHYNFIFMGDAATLERVILTRKE
jgi:hypothetical protein